MAEKNRKVLPGLSLPDAGREDALFGRGGGWEGEGAVLRGNVGGEEKHADWGGGGQEGEARCFEGRGKREGERFSAFGRRRTGKEDALLWRGREWERTAAQDRRLACLTY